MTTIAALPQAVALRPGSITGMARMSEHINRPRKPTTASVPGALWSKVTPILTQRKVDDAALMREILTAYVLGDFDPAAVTLPNEYVPRRGRPTKDRIRVEDDTKKHGLRAADDLVVARPYVRLSEVEQWALEQRSLQAVENGETMWNRSAVITRGAYVLVTEAAAEAKTKKKNRTFGKKADADLEAPAKPAGGAVPAALWTKASAKLAERGDSPEKVMRRILYAFILDEFDPASVVLPPEYGPQTPTEFVSTHVTPVEKWSLDRKALLATRAGTTMWTPAAVITAGLQKYVSTRKGAKLPF